MYDSKNPDKQELSKIPRDELGRILPGKSLNPAGRPKGKTIKELVRDWLQEHPDDMEAFVKHFVKKNRDLAWRMLEGNPQNDITSGGEKINPIPIIKLDDKEWKIKEKTDIGDTQEES